MANRTRQVTAAPGAPFWRQALESDAVNLAHDRQKRIHAVIDGAFFDDLPKLLADHGLAARPLFTGNTPQALVNAGPWLVDLYHMPFQEPDETAMATGSDGADGPDLSDEALKVQAAALAEDMRRLVEAGDDTGGLPQKSDEDMWKFGPPADPAAQIRALIHIAGDKPALVFWIGGPDLTPARLWKHLRSLNMVRVETAQNQTQATNLEWMMFRHSDANVLAQTLPAFDEAQFARFLGSAMAVIFVPEPDYTEMAGPQHARWYEGLPQAAAGPLTLDRAAIGAVEHRRNLAIRRGITAHLRVESTKLSWPVNNADVDAAVERSEATASELGIKTAENRKLWAWLDLASAGNFGRSASIREHLTRPGADHDWDMDNLVALTEAKLRNE